MRSFRHLFVSVAALVGLGTGLLAPIAATAAPAYAAQPSNGAGITCYPTDGNTVGNAVPTCNLYDGVGSNYGQSSSPDLGTSAATAAIDKAAGGSLTFGASFLSPGTGYGVPPSCSNFDVAPMVSVYGAVEVCGYWIFGQGGGPGTQFGAIQITNILDWYANDGHLSWISPGQSTSGSWPYYCFHNPGQCSNGGFYLGANGDLHEVMTIGTSGVSIWTSVHGVAMQNGSNIANSAYPAYQAYQNPNWPEPRQNGASGSSGLSLALQYDSNLVVNSGSGVLWNATGGRSYRIPVTNTPGSQYPTSYPSGSAHPGSYETIVWFYASGANAATCKANIGLVQGAHWYRGTPPPGCNVAEPTTSVDNGSGGVVYSNVALPVPAYGQQFYVIPMLYSFTGAGSYKATGAAYSFELDTGWYQYMTVEPPASAPTITLGPGSQTVATGQAATVTANATSVPPNSGIKIWSSTSPNFPSSTLVAQCANSSGTYASMSCTGSATESSPTTLYFHAFVYSFLAESATVSATWQAPGPASITANGQSGTVDVLNGTKVNLVGRVSNTLGANAVYLCDAKDGFFFGAMPVSPNGTSAVQMDATTLGNSNMSATYWMYTSTQQGENGGSGSLGNACPGAGVVAQASVTVVWQPATVNLTATVNGASVAGQSVASGSTVTFTGTSSSSSLGYLYVCIAGNVGYYGGGAAAGQTTLSKYWSFPATLGGKSYPAGSYTFYAYTSNTPGEGGLNGFGSTGNPCPNTSAMTAESAPIAVDWQASAPTTTTTTTTTVPPTTTTPGYIVPTAYRYGAKAADPRRTTTTVPPVSS